jgi:hypothetical protein
MQQSFNNFFVAVPQVANQLGKFRFRKPVLTFFAGMTGHSYAPSGGSRCGTYIDSTGCKNLLATRTARQIKMTNTPSDMPAAMRQSGGAAAGGWSKMSDEALVREREPIERVRARLEALVRANATRRCGARSKRTGMPCRAAAMPNGRCKVHGGKSTAHIAQPGTRFW